MNEILLEPPSPLTEGDRAVAVKELAGLLALLKTPMAGVMRYPGGEHDEARRVVEEIRRDPSVSLILPTTTDADGNLEWSYEPPPLREPLSRLLWLLGLSPGERGFVQALADTPSDGVTLSVFSDWLRDQNRDDEVAVIEGGAIGPLAAEIASSVTGESINIIHVGGVATLVEQSVALIRRLKGESAALASAARTLETENARLGLELTYARADAEHHRYERDRESRR